MRFEILLALDDISFSNTASVFRTQSRKWNLAMVIWSLKPKLERKFALGHPWVFSSDLAESPKGINPGELVELRDANGNFLAVGYGHPNTLIAFRVLAREPVRGATPEFFARRFLQAFRLRKQSGLQTFSYRLSFAEADDLPGLVVDRYRLRQDESGSRFNRQVFVLQASTAGIDRLLPEIIKGLELFVQQLHSEVSSEISWQETAVIIANDSKSRDLEGLKSEVRQVVKGLDGFDASQAQIAVQPPVYETSAPFEAATVFDVDFLNGQKTGFFLDQRSNVEAVSRVLQNLSSQRLSPVRVLDLCSYVGQWSTQLTRVLKSNGRAAQVTIFDSSTLALNLAAQNAARYGAQVETFKGDVLRDLNRVAPQAFEVVICDPPAFIKKKKDIPTGEKAYQKLNREAMSKLAPGGLFFSSSCSGLLSDDHFRLVLARAQSQASRLGLRWMFRGSHGPDHPQRPNFTQGSYLKSWLALDLGE